ncbi:DMT family transporter [Variovorax sp. RHLX14]|uniref:DMT family transporter n=1 Tax=Variovorax sp. RHLX14 TaxID=1259731 RepID=UPI003F479C69
MKNASMTGAAMALAAAALWGTTGTAQSLAPGLTSPYWVGALRLAVASLFFAAFLFLSTKQRLSAFRMPRATWGRIALAGLCVAAYNLTFFAGVKATGVAVGTAVAIGSGPIWAGALQSLFFRQTPTRAWWLGTILAVTGGCLMVMPAPDAGSTGPGIDGFGIALCLAAGLSYACYTLLSQRLVSEAPPPTVTFWVFTVAAVVAVPMAFFVSGPFAAALPDWLVVVYLGLVSTGIAYLLFSYALQRISGATGVTLALAEPVTAFALAVLVLREQPTAMAFAGLACVLAGLVLVVWIEARRGR